jgi:hypothetical protein
LSEAVGTKDHDFLSGILGQLATVGSNGQKVDERTLNFMLSMVKGVDAAARLRAMVASSRRLATLPN